jgi:hypothetical protein
VQDGLKNPFAALYDLANAHALLGINLKLMVNGGITPSGRPF